MRMRFQQVQRADAGDFGGRQRLIEGHADEALRGQVVDFVGLRALQQADAGAEVGQVVFDQIADWDDRGCPAPRCARN